MLAALQVDVVGSTLWTTLMTQRPNDVVGSTLVPYGNAGPILQIEGFVIIEIARMICVLAHCSLGKFRSSRTLRTLHRPLGKFRSSRTLLSSR